MALTSVYYPSEQERQEMNDLVAQEAKIIKAQGIKTPSDRGLTHGGLLLQLGRLWRSHSEIKALVRKAYADAEAGIDAEKRYSSDRKNRAKKRPLNQKTNK